MLCCLALAATSQLKYQDMHVLVVHCSVFKSQRFNNFPGAEVIQNKVASVWETLGVPTKQVKVLVDYQAETQRIDFEFREKLSQVKPGQTLLVWYSGHGYWIKNEPTLASLNAEVGSPGWRISRINRLVKRFFHGKQIIWVVDACSSGSIAEQLDGQLVVFSSASGRSPAPDGWEFQTSLLDSITKNGIDFAKVSSDMKNAWPQGTYNDRRAR